MVAETKVYKNLDATAIADLGKRLRDGQLVAIPTETVYGLGANGLDEVAMSRIYEAKGRPSDNPLILHVPNQASVEPLVKEISPTAKKLMDAFWPGPLTIIMPKSDRVPLRATGGLDSVAIRCPKHEICRAILEAAGVPIAAPSANISGRPSPTTADAVYHDMNGRIEAIADAGPCEVGVESTIVECGDDSVTILRPGGVTDAMLRQVVSAVNFDEALTAPDVTPKAPGMKYKHYAPDGEMTTYVGVPKLISEAMIEAMKAIQESYNTLLKESVAKGHSETIQPLRFGFFINEEVAQFLDIYLAELSVPFEFVIYGNAADYRGLAHSLYAALLSFNEAGVTHIFATGVPRQGLGRAIMNRMDKASGYKIVTAVPKR
ncbi:L-threonylcarbamoyladenylate synthase [Veillonella criceti]|uniref:Threonylcarbamoyl-AMP synthase n=1 Tax=Veillonella criceti TaxID=103891 RepID=A0A380NHQ4_9FIRM|nr:L-threonylcarbamoyladenylate synthase [Veillonella criceti]SUP39948.1 t(6)A37 threonylcarbamoyladenosine biosynthesis protein RimN [Veillonella criceti]